mmetsp:Transcript_29972/g.47825  ORF Transcript_29972/g.47825 Transcript_29972/m.47825 type:complete len:218 (+) Transcript_29972:1833-2486(+)
MKEGFLRSQALQIRVCHKSTCFWTEITFVKVRQSAITKAIRNSFTHHVLLSDTGDNLRDIDGVTFGSRVDHLFDIVQFMQRTLHCLTGFVHGFVEDLVHFVLKRINQRGSRLSIQFTQPRFFDIGGHILLGRGDFLGDIFQRRRRSNGVPHSNRRRILQQKAADQHIQLVDKVGADGGSLLVEDDMDQRLRLCANGLFVDNTGQQLALLDAYKCVRG